LKYRKRKQYKYKSAITSGFYFFVEMEEDFPALEPVGVVEPQRQTIVMKVANIIFVSFFCFHRLYAVGRCSFGAT
jgi:hypothetical protein